MKNIGKQLRRSFLTLVLILIGCEIKGNETVEVDGINYYLYYLNTGHTIKRAHVKAKTGGYVGDILIPEQVEYNGECYTVVDIEEDSFSSCIGLTSVVLPNTISYIPNGCFRGCGNLESITIPPSVTEVGPGAFAGCVSLVSVHISDLSAWCRVRFLDYDNDSGMEDDVPFCCTHHLYLDGNKITDLVIPNEVTRIENYTFYGCEDLLSVNIPQFVKHIGENAFAGCALVHDVYISDLATWCEMDWSGSFGCYYRLYLNGEEINNLMIPDTVVSVRERAFAGCESLITVEFPPALTEVSKGMFAECRNLKRAWLCNVTTIGAGAFYRCKNLMRENNVGLTTIGEYAYCGCDKIEYVNLPTTVTTIKQGAFSSCIGLKQVEIPSSVSCLEDWMFGGCTNLVSVSLPKSVTYFGRGVFKDCSSLVTMDIPESAVNIGAEMFEGCINLSSLRISASITNIGALAFKDCRVLTTVEIPSSVTEIGLAAFSGCHNLISVSIPSSVVKIGGDICQNSENMQELFLLSSSLEVMDGYSGHGEYFYAHKSIIEKFGHTLTDV